MILGFNIKKFFSYRMLHNILMFAIILLLCACKEEDGMSKGSEENLAKQADCWQTYIINAVLLIIDKLFNLRLSTIAQPQTGGAVIMAGFAVWVGFKFLKILPSFKAQNTGEFLTEVGHKLFLCAFCAWAISSSSNFVYVANIFLVSIYDTIMELASGTVNISQSANFNLGVIGDVTFSNNYTNCKAQLADISSGLKSTVAPMANCLVCSISTRLNAGIKIGVELICSFDISAMIVGLGLIIFFTVAKFGFALFVIDSLFRLNFAADILTLILVCIPFAYTRKWAVHIFLMFLNSSGIMLFIGLLVGLAVNALEIIIGSIGPTLEEGKLDSFAPELMAMLMISLLLFSIPGLGVKLADTFIGGGGGPDFHKKISRFIIDSSKKAGAAVLAYISGGATSTITSALDKYEKTRSAADSVRQTAHKLNEKLNSLAGYNDE
ncbi:MAG: hypothetical protein IKW58_02485 [Alphaproteobacteria bacterium]|nr:hypothetical protein [Alphaproteobacteria bacterium]